MPNFPYRGGITFKFTKCPQKVRFDLEKWVASFRPIGSSAFCVGSLGKISAICWSFHETSRLPTFRRFPSKQSTFRRFNSISPICW